MSGHVLSVVLRSALCMTERRTYVRHGRSTAIRRVRAEGIGAIDGRLSAAREVKALRRELALALGGEEQLSPQRRRLVELAARASLIIDVIDGWVLQQPTLVNARNRSLLPVVVQRQAVAEHLAKLLDRLGLERVPAKVKTLEEITAEILARRPAAPDHAGDGHDDGQE